MSGAVLLGSEAGASTTPKAGAQQRPSQRAQQPTRAPSALPSATDATPRSDERFIAFKELIINNGLSNARNALRSALALASITNRTLILPPYWSRHLRGEPHRVGVDYYFDHAKLIRAFPRYRLPAC